MTLERPDPATVFDEVTSWKVRSRSDCHVEYQCELLSYSGNGACDCPDFTMRFAKLLGQGITPEQALERKLVDNRPGYRRSDALRCWHLVNAFTEFEHHLITVFTNVKKKTGFEARD